MFYSFVLSTNLLKYLPLEKPPVKCSDVLASELLYLSCFNVSKCQFQTSLRKSQKSDGTSFTTPDKEMILIISIEEINWHPSS